MPGRDVVSARLVLKDLDVTATSSCQYRDRLFIGGADGSLRTFLVFTRRGRVRLELVDTVRRFANDKKPITQLTVVPAWNCLLSISSGGLAAHAMDCVRVGTSGTSLLPEAVVAATSPYALTPIKLPAATKGATGFAVGPESRLIVTCGGKGNRDLCFLLAHLTKMDMYHDSSSATELDGSETESASASGRRGSELQARRVRSWSIALPEHVGASLSPVQLSSMDVLWQREPLLSVDAVTSISLKEIPTLPVAAASAAELALARMPGLRSGISMLGGGRVTYEGTEYDEAGDDDDMDGESGTGSSATAQARGRAAVQKQTQSRGFTVCILLGLIDGVVAYDVMQNDLLNISTPESIDAAAKKRQQAFGEGKEVSGVAAQLLARAKAEVAASKGSKTSSAATAKAAKAAEAASELADALSGSADDGFATAAEATEIAKASLIAGSNPSSLTVCHTVWLPTLPDTSGSGRRQLPGVDAKALAAAERMGRSRLVVHTAMRQSDKAKDRADSGAGRGGDDSGEAVPSIDYALVGASVLEAVRPFEPGSWCLDEVGGTGDWLDPTLSTAAMASSRASQGRLGLAGFAPASRSPGLMPRVSLGNGQVVRGMNTQVEEGDQDLLPPTDDACASLGLSLRTGLATGASSSLAASSSSSSASAVAAGSSSSSISAFLGSAGGDNSGADGGSAAGIAALATSPLLGGKLLVTWGRHSSLAGIVPGARLGEVAWRLPTDKATGGAGPRWSQQPVAVFPCAAQPTVVSILPDGVEVHDSASGLMVSAVPINTVVTAVRCEESTDLRRASLTPSRQALAAVLQRHGRATLGPVAKRAAAALAVSGTRAEVLLEAVSRWQALREVLLHRHREFTGDTSAGAPSPFASGSAGMGGAASWTPSSSAMGGGGGLAGRGSGGRRRSSVSSTTTQVMDGVEAQASAMWAGLPSPEAVRCAAEWAERCLSEPEAILVVCKRAIVSVTLQPPVVEVAGLVTAGRPLFAPALRACEMAVWRSKRVRAVGRQRRRHVLDLWWSTSGETASAALDSIARRRQMELQEAVRRTRVANASRSREDDEDDDAVAGSALATANGRSSRTATAAATVAASSSGQEQSDDPSAEMDTLVTWAAIRRSVTDDLLSGCLEDTSWFALGGTVPRTRVRELQAIIGYRKFDQGAFSEGLGHLLLSGERPRRVLALFPSLLPKGVVLRRWLPVRVGLVIDEVMGDAIEALVRFLTVARRLLALRRQRMRRALPDGHSVPPDDIWEKEDATDFAALIARVGETTKAEAPMLLLHAGDEVSDSEDDSNSNSDSDKEGDSMEHKEEAGAGHRSGVEPVLGRSHGNGGTRRQRVAVVNADDIEPADWSMGELSTIGGRGGAAEGLGRSSGRGGKPDSSPGRRAISAESLPGSRFGGVESLVGDTSSADQLSYDRLFGDSGSASRSGGSAGSARLCRVEDVDEGVLVDTCLAAACTVWEAWALRSCAASGQRVGSAPSISADDTVAMMRTSSAPMDVDTRGFRLDEGGRSKAHGRAARGNTAQDSSDDDDDDQDLRDGDVAGYHERSVSDEGPGALSVRVAGGTGWLRVRPVDFIGGEAAVAGGRSDLWDSDEEEEAESSALRRATQDEANADASTSSVGRMQSGRRRRGASGTGSGSSANALKVPGSSASAVAARERIRARRTGNTTSSSSSSLLKASSSRGSAVRVSGVASASGLDKVDATVAIAGAGGLERIVVPPPRARRDTVHSASGASPFGGPSSIDITKVVPIGPTGKDMGAASAILAAARKGAVSSASASASGGDSSSWLTRRANRFTYGTLPRNPTEAMSQLMPRRSSAGKGAPRGSQKRSHGRKVSQPGAGRGKASMYDDEEEDDDDDAYGAGTQGQTVSAEVQAARRTLRLLLISPNLCDSAETTLRLRRAGKWAEVLLLLAARSQFDEAVQLLSQSLDARVSEASSLKATFVIARDDYYQAIAQTRTRDTDAAAAVASIPSLRARASEAKAHWKAASRRARRRLRLLLAFVSCLGRPSQQLVLWTLRPLLRGALGRRGSEGALGVICQRKPGDWLRRAAAARRRAEGRADRRQDLFAQSEAAGTAPHFDPSQPAAGASIRKWRSAENHAQSAGGGDVPEWLAPQLHEAWLSIEKEAASDLAETKRLPWWAGLGPDLGLGLGVPVPFPSQAGMDTETLVDWLDDLDSQAQTEDESAAQARTAQAAQASTAQAAGSPTAAMRFLEFLVHEIGDPLHKHHERLVRLYTAELLRLVRLRKASVPVPSTAHRTRGGSGVVVAGGIGGSATPSSTSTVAHSVTSETVSGRKAAVSAANEPGRIGSLRRRLLRLLGASPAIPAAELLGALPEDELLEERVLLLRRLGFHRQALEICVCRLHDVDLAVRYCDAVTVADLLLNEGAPAAMWTAGREMLARAAAAAATRLGVFQRPSTSGLLVQDDEDEAEDDTEAFGRATMASLTSLVSASGAEHGQTGTGLSSSPPPQPASVAGVAALAVAGGTPAATAEGVIGRAERHSIAGLPSHIASAWWRESGSAAVRSALYTATRLADALQQERASALATGGVADPYGVLAVTASGVAELASGTVPVMSQGPVLSSASRRNPVYGLLMEIVTATASPLQAHSSRGDRSAHTAEPAVHASVAGSSDSVTHMLLGRHVTVPLSASAVGSPIGVASAHGRLLSPSPVSKMTVSPARGSLSRDAPVHTATAQSQAALSTEAVLANRTLLSNTIQALESRASVLPATSVLSTLPGSISIASVRGLLSAMVQSTARDSRSSAIEQAMTKSRSIETTMLLQQRREQLAAATARLDAQAEHLEATRRAEMHEAARLAERERLRAAQAQGQEDAVSGGRATIARPLAKKAEPPVMDATGPGTSSTGGIGVGSGKQRAGVTGSTSNASRGGSSSTDDASARLRRRRERLGSKRRMVPAQK